MAKRTGELRTANRELSSGTAVESGGSGTRGTCIGAEAGAGAVNGMRDTRQALRQRENIFMQDILAAAHQELNTPWWEVCYPIRHTHIHTLLRFLFNFADCARSPEGPFGNGFKPEPQSQSQSESQSESQSQSLPTQVPLRKGKLDQKLSICLIFLFFSFFFWLKIESADEL